MTQNERREYLINYLLKEDKKISDREYRIKGKNRRNCFVP